MGGNTKQRKKTKAKLAAKKKLYQVEKDKGLKKKVDQDQDQYAVGDGEIETKEEELEETVKADECASVEIPADCKEEAALPLPDPGSDLISIPALSDQKGDENEKDENMNFTKELDRMATVSTADKVEEDTETPIPPAKSFANSILSPNAKPFSLKPASRVMKAAAQQDGSVKESGSVKKPAPAIRFLATKHPLRYKWTLWHFFHYPNTNWEDNQRMVLTVEYVEDFFSLFNWVKSCSELGHGHDYSFFKEDIKPMWEDHYNRNGGRWTCNLESNRNGLSTEEATATDERWMELLMAMIGDTVTQSYGHMVNGAVFSVRKTFKRTSVWLNQTSNSEGVLAIGKHVKNLLRLPSNAIFGFESHRASMVKTSTSKYMYRI